MWEMTLQYIDSVLPLQFLREYVSDAFYLESLILEMEQLFKIPANGSKTMLDSSTTF